MGVGEFKFSPIWAVPEVREQGYNGRGTPWMQDLRVRLFQSARGWGCGGRTLPKHAWGPCPIPSKIKTVTRDTG